MKNKVKTNGMIQITERQAMCMMYCGEMNVRSKFPIDGWSPIIRVHLLAVESWRKAGLIKE